MLELNTCDLKLVNYTYIYFDLIAYGKRTCSRKALLNKAILALTVVSLKELIAPKSF